MNRQHQEVVLMLCKESIFRVVKLWILRTLPGSCWDNSKDFWSENKLSFYMSTYWKYCHWRANYQIIPALTHRSTMHPLFLKKLSCTWLVLWLESIIMIISAPDLWMKTFRHFLHLPKNVLAKTKKKNQPKIISTHVHRASILF